MQIVIDIPKEKYDMVRNETYCGIYDAVIYKAIVNGTPLPKGHGALIDKDALYEQFEYSDYDFEETLEYATVIIPADTGSED